MIEIEGRENIEAAVRRLLAVGMFHPACFHSPLTAGEVREIAYEVSDCPLVDTVDGWTVALSSETLVARSLRRIAGVLGRVPHHETLASLVRMIDGSDPELAGFYAATPGVPALSAVLGWLDCAHDGEIADFSTLEDCIDPTDLEEDIFRQLEATLDGNLSTSALIRRIGKSGKRTWFNDKVLPATPFLGGGKNGQPVRLLGFFPDPALHRDLGPSFIGLEQSACGTRLLLEYRLTEEAVETASFNVAADAKEAVNGSYAVSGSKKPIVFNKDGKDARKLTGLRTAILSMFPRYVNGQRAFVQIDKEASAASVVVIDSTDYEARERIRAWLGDEPDPAPSMAA